MREITSVIATALIGIYVLFLVFSCKLDNQHRDTATPIEEIQTKLPADIIQICANGNYHGEVCALLSNGEVWLISYSGKVERWYGIDPSQKGR